MVWPGAKCRAAAPGCTLCAGFAGAADGFGYRYQTATGRAVDEAVAVVVHGGAFATTVGLSGSIVWDATVKDGAISAAVQSCPHLWWGSKGAWHLLHFLGNSSTPVVPGVLLLGTSPHRGQR